MKIRVLAVIPFSGLDTVIRQVSAEFPEIEVIFEYGELSRGVNIALNHSLNDIDAIVSRGGTASMIWQKVKIPTFDIGVSADDLINTLVLARNTHCKKISLVGFKEVTEIAKSLDRLLEIPISVYETPTADANLLLMKRLKREGVDLVIGDATSVRFASSVGINNIMIPSGKSSVRRCFKEISRLFAMNEGMAENLRVLKQAVKSCDLALIVFDAKGQILHESLPYDYLGSLNSLQMEKISGEFLQEFLKDGAKSQKIINLDRQAFLLTAKTQTSGFAACSTILWRRILCMNGAPPDGAVTELSDDSILKLENYVSEDQGVNLALDNAKAYAKTMLPIMIEGEKNTGRKLVAKFIFKNGEFGVYGLYALDALKLNDASMEKLFDFHNSVLSVKNITLLVLNLEAAAASVCDRLLAFFSQSGMCRRSRLIFILQGNDVGLKTRLAKDFDALSIIVPPLRERVGDINFISALTLGEYAVRFGKNVLGFTDQAKSLLLSHTWPGNIRELDYVIRQSVIGVKTLYIGRELLLEEILKWNAQERSAYAGLDLLQGTLSQIENKIVFEVLCQEKGRKADTAQRLGISRNTLWRKLKDMGVK